ncbi:hypothetical protein G3I15_14010 [Streptomyces sp. SID10244]|nr:hypothetical protein [Streptomyces sp. SID10244]
MRRELHDLGTDRTRDIVHHRPREALGNLGRTVSGHRTGGRLLQRVVGEQHVVGRVEPRTSSTATPHRLDQGAVV